VSTESTSEDARLEQLEMQLTRIERLLAIGFAAQIEAARERAGVNDEVTAAILARASVWISAGALKRAAVKRSGQSERTVNRRLNQLVELDALERRGKTSSTEYRSTGLLG
jgi:hypothetical protein